MPVISSIVAGTVAVASTVASAAGLATLAGVGAVVGGSLLKGGQKQPGQIQSPNTPKAEDSLAKAQADAKEKQRTAILAGGQTTTTSPLGATLMQSQTQKKTLLGA